ncbi:hypothetical protein N8T08_007708 [Aspergillus melleus]|uniref:Uncharacterized protein n=1 Tax=Aspergillus melleus TaxID=138277 RepID=A0ACC3BEE6_9EURO|nr:hypothetical protein N8T08_007708 [Aspergillus melleus]
MALAVLKIANMQASGSNPRQVARIRGVQEGQVQGSKGQDFESQEVNLELGWWDTPTSSSPEDTKAAVEEARRTLLASTNNQSTTAFSYSGNALVGLYVGHGVLHSDAATTALQHFTQYLKSQNTIGRVLLQFCGVNSNKALGIVVGTTGDFSAVQRIMRGWNEAKCQTNFDGSKKLPNAALRLERPLAQTSLSTDHLARRNSHHGVHRVHSIHKRATCKTIQVASGDSCGSLAKECGISGAKFEQYNPDKKLCSTLSVGQYVCCTAGDLPDLTPKPKPDGTCASVLVEPGDLCSTIAAANSLTPKDLENFNKKTWGWAGLSKMLFAVRKFQSQFDSLLSMGDVHRVLSFGGWSFSTEVDSFPIFREGVTDANRELFATNVAKFIVDNDLEGVDFDWEYPGAPDIPGIPAGDERDGERYLQFLKLVRKKLPPSKTLAIAAPASFWYLKGFPIAEISKVVDYIVYMTYDLHGQWDYGNKYSTSGCSEGDCLRSHVNLTETTSALSMITKAGVSADKIIVGLASYGRSFKMTKPGCTGPMCRFVGPDSGAAKGECTDTAGYISDAEIYRILDKDNSAKTHYDKSSDSNILVYGSTEWVAFMDEHTRSSRTDHYQGLNMGGTTDWAVDLQAFGFSGGKDGGHSGGGGGGGRGSLNQSIIYISPSIWTDGKDPAPVQCPAPCVLVLPDFPLSSMSVISRPPYVTTLDVAWPTAATLTTDGSTVTTTTVTRILQETTIKAPAVTVTSLPMANLNITVPIKANSTITITPRPRFPAQTVTITNHPNLLGLTSVSHPPVTRSVTLPPWPQGTVIYYPKDSVDNGEDDNNDDDNDDNDDNDDGHDDNNDDDNNNDDDIDLPHIPVVTVKDGPGSPGCGKDEDCGSLCSGPLDFCSCFICPKGGGAGDAGFSDPNDPNPPPRPPGDPVNNNNNDRDDPDKTCTKTSTETNYWVSCKSLESASTSCTTTSSMLAIGCDITATTTTTGEGVCSSFNPDEDQGDSNGRATGGATTVPTVSATSTTSKSTTTTSAGRPTPTAADGCAIMSGGQGVCWNKCDPSTGKPIDGMWEEGDAWCWLKDDDMGAFCNHVEDCPAHFECQPSDWNPGGCKKPEPMSGGCASMDGKQGVCWSKCDPDTSEPVNEQWNKGDPWCWLKDDDIGAFCSKAKDCPAKLQCQPSSWKRGGCSSNEPLMLQSFSFNGTSSAISRPQGLRLDLY